MPFSRWSDMTRRSVVEADWGVGVEGGVLVRPPLLPNVTKCKVEFSAPSLQNWPRERTCERRDGMSFAVQASLGDSCDVYRPASMTVVAGVAGGRVGGGVGSFQTGIRFVIRF